MTDAKGLEVPDLRGHLLTCVLPFWATHSIDQDHGGFITHLTRDGRLAADSHKFLVMQTRMIYSLAAGSALGGPGEWLNLASQGVAFFLRHFRDVEHDGWFWSVSRDGEPRETRKRTYGHAFAVYALAEYARIAGDHQALAAAGHTWSLIEDRLWDKEHDGVVEECDREWRCSDPCHSMGTHLHALEALLALDEATAGDRYRHRVRAICDLIVDRMVDARHQCGLEEFDSDWSHRAGPDPCLVNYGHNFEAAWLLLRVHQVESTPAYRDTAQQFLDYGLRFGLDGNHGGVFSHGPLGEAATVREKVWWVQCEALVALLAGYLAFGDPRYWEAFHNVWDFCLRCLHDPECGEWYASTEENGTPKRVDKGSAWKAAYHVTQALSYGHHYLSEIASRR